MSCGERTIRVNLPATETKTIHREKKSEGFESQLESDCPSGKAMNVRPKKKWRGKQRGYWTRQSGNIN